MARLAGWRREVRLYGRGVTTTPKLPVNIKRAGFSAAALTALFLAQPSFAQDDWSLAKDSEGIKVYVRAVPDSPLREFRGEVQLEATPDSVVRVLRDADAFRKWMPDVAVSELLKATAANSSTT